MKYCADLFSTLVGEGRAVPRANGHIEWTFRVGPFRSRSTLSFVSARDPGTRVILNPIERNVGVAYTLRTAAQGPVRTGAPLRPGEGGR